jgi:hypothetical protein
MIALDFKQRSPLAGQSPSLSGRSLAIALLQIGNPCLNAMMIACVRYETP